MKSSVIIFLIIIYIPLAAIGISHFFSLPFDVPLAGYVDEAEKPAFSLDSFLSAQYQPAYSAWLDSSLYPRGILIKTYGSLNYHLFNTGNQILGHNHDVFEQSYINAQLCITEGDDFSLQENKQSMHLFIEDLTAVQKKLQAYGKSLYVFITPSKADFHSSNIPEKYLALSRPCSTRAVDYFRECMEQTDIPYFICADMKGQLEYPAFYTTGIHWSKSYEQLASHQIISHISHVTGKNYRNIILDDASSSALPYERDSDVYDLLNIWGQRNNTYYKYNCTRQYPQKYPVEYDKMRFLIYGDSFGEGLRKIILDSYPYEEIFYINYVNYVTDKNSSYTYLEGSWDNFDFGYYLDNTDVVVMEMNECMIKDYTLGFAENLNRFLDTYSPNTTEINPMASVDASSGEEWNYDSLYGIYPKDTDFAWAAPYSEMFIQDAGIYEQGMEISLRIPEQIFLLHPNDEISIYVNGKQVYNCLFQGEWADSVIIPKDEIEKVGTDNGLFRVEIICSQSITGDALWQNGNDNDLAIQISYVGRAR